MLLFVLILEQGAESLAAGLGRSFSSFSSVRRPFTLSGRLTCLAYTAHAVLERLGSGSAALEGAVNVLVACEMEERGK